MVGNVICVLDITSFSWESMDREKYPIEYFVFSQKKQIYNFNDKDIYIYPQRTMITIFESTDLNLKSNCMYISDFEIPLIFVQDIQIVAYKTTRILKKPIIPQYILDFVTDALSLKGLKSLIKFESGSWFDEYLKVYLQKEKTELQKGAS